MTSESKNWLGLHEYWQYYSHW